MLLETSPPEVRVTVLVDDANTSSAGPALRVRFSCQNNATGVSPSGKLSLGTAHGGRDLLDAMVVSTEPSSEVLQDEDDDAAELRPIRIDHTTDTGFSGVATLTSDKLAIHEGAFVFASFTCADALGRSKTAHTQRPVLYETMPPMGGALRLVEYTFSTDEVVWLGGANSSSVTVTWERFVDAASGVDLLELCAGLLDPAQDAAPAGRCSLALQVLDPNTTSAIIDLSELLAGRESGESSRRYFVTLVAIDRVGRRSEEAVALAQVGFTVTKFSIPDSQSCRLVQSHSSL